MFVQLLSGSIETFMPSWNGVPPQPPAGIPEKMEDVPVCASTVFATNQLPSLKVGAMIRSGIACASACQIAAQIFEDARVVRRIVGAGHSAFSHVLSGTMISNRPVIPAFCGAVGFRKNLSE